MGSAAAIAHGVALTSDNPRDEDPYQIMNEALTGCLNAGLTLSNSGPAEGKVWVEVDRGVAIHRLISEAHPHDQILIAGKGHEPYQELSRGARVPFSDQDHVIEGLRIRLLTSQGSRDPVTSYTHHQDDTQDHAQGDLMTFSLHSAALCRDAGGVLRAGSHQQLSGAAIDTRTIERSPTSGIGPAFFCLRGARDGHDFIESALEAGASAIVVRRAWIMSDEIEACVQAHNATIIEVSDPERALALWAHHHRQRVFSGVLIGLTGSNGKTSTKDLLASALAQVGATLATAGNFNNHLGVPLTLLRLRPEHKFAVIEMGMNAPDEIRQLTTWADPDLGVITTIASAHLEKLGSIEAVARAKGELISAIKAGPVIIPHTIERSLRHEAASERVDISTTLEGAEDTDILILAPSLRDTSISLLPHERLFSPHLALRSIQCHLAGGEALIDLGEHEVGSLKTQLLGRHQLDNARLALAASIVAVSMSAHKTQSSDQGQYKPLDMSELDLTRVHDLLSGISACPPAPLRGEILAYPRVISDSSMPSEIAGLTAQQGEPLTSAPSGTGQLWLDCYNANPQSVLASLRTFLDCGLEGALVLGSIGELGVKSSTLHRELGREIAHLISKQTRVFTVGDDALHLQYGLRDEGVEADLLEHFSPSELDHLVEHLRTLSPAALLVKGSRSIRLERIAPLLKAYTPPSNFPSTISPSR
jgi:UDP-N-acetylmuramyl pentapeptide synthase